MTDQERAEAFCRELTELSRKYNMAIRVTEWEGLGLFGNSALSYTVGAGGPLFWVIDDEDIAG